MSISQVTRKSDEDYLKSIEISNSCREFYLNRLKSSENHKEKMKKFDEKSKRTALQVSSSQKCPMQSAMEMLRKEVTSLMDQDLSLMKQLLTLNETIEELKFKRLNQVCKDSLKSASLELIESDSNSNMAETRHLSGSQNSLSYRSQILETLNQNDVIGSSSSDSVQYKFFMNGSMLSPFEKNMQTEISDSLQTESYMDGKMLPSLHTHENTGSKDSVLNEFFMDGSMLSPFKSDTNSIVQSITNKNTCNPRHLPLSCLDNRDADESDEEYMLTKDIKSCHKIQICNDSGYEESGSDQDYTGTTL